MNSPLLAICVPTIGRESLFRAVESISVLVKAERKSIQLIISDNSQNDDFHLKLFEYFSNISSYFHPSSLVLRQVTRLAMASNWSACAKNSKADWTTILSDDDEYINIEPEGDGIDFIRYLQNLLFANIDVICFSSLVDLYGAFVAKDRCSTDISIRIPRLSSTIFKSSYLRDNNYFSERDGYGADYMSLKAVMDSRKYIISNTCLGTYKLHSSNSINQSRQITYPITRKRFILSHLTESRKYYGFYWYTSSFTGRVLLAILFPRRLFAYLYSYPWAILLAMLFYQHKSTRASFPE
jgi:hypothetical protein